MKWTLCALIALAACKKDPNRIHLQATANCKMCAVEYTFDGSIRKDTIIGEVVATWVDGVAILDTVPVSASFNPAVDDGATFYFRACRLRQGQDDGAISITIQGASTPIATSVAYPASCAVVDQSVH